MILIALKDLINRDQVDQALNKYFEQKEKPNYKFINKFENFNSWSPVLVNPQEYNLEEELVEFLSTELDLLVFGYEYVDIVTTYVLYLYKSGECIDEFTSADYEILNTLGYFDYLDDLSDEEKEEINTEELLESYYTHLGFDPNYVKFEDQY